MRDFYLPWFICNLIADKLVCSEWFYFVHNYTKRIAWHRKTLGIEKRSTDYMESACNKYFKLNTTSSVLNETGENVLTLFIYVLYFYRLGSVALRLRMKTGKRKKNTRKYSIHCLNRWIKFAMQIYFLLHLHLRISKSCFLLFCFFQEMYL